MIYAALGSTFVILIWVTLLYNKLISLRNHLLEAESNIDVQLKRRFDLIPNLVSVAKNYGVYEKTTLKEIVEMRPQNRGLVNSDNQRKVSQSLKSLLLLVEKYPEIKADESFENLFDQLVEIEDDIQMTRRYFNGAVRELNTKIESFPNVLFASFLGFREAEFLEFEVATQKVSFDVV